MSQQAVERTLGKVLTDGSFRERFLTAPRVAALQAGLQLSDIELAALSGLSRAALSSFSASLDPRICRLGSEGEWSPEEGRPGPPKPCGCWVSTPSSSCPPCS